MGGWFCTSTWIHTRAWKTCGDSRQAIRKGRCRARAGSGPASTSGACCGAFSYWKVGKADKGLLRRCLARTTGLSRAQLARLIRRYLRDGELRDRRGRAARPFPRKYTRADILLLAATDELHCSLSGPATLALLKRAWEVYGDARYERLAGLSNGHLHNLRRSQPYVLRMGRKDPARPSPVAIGERRKPRPEGLPGWVRVDSVHQGDQDKVKGVYHINVVDEVTQYQFSGSVERISEHFLLPVLESLLEAFPFPVRGFHSDYGSENVNYRVAGPAGEAARGGIHRVAAQTVQRQRPRGVEERDGHPQAFRLRAHPRAACRAAARLPPRRAGTVPELPSPLLLPQRAGRRQGPRAQALPPAGHHDALPEAAVTARRGRLPAARDRLRTAGRAGRRVQRQRGRAAAQPGPRQAVRDDPGRAGQRGLRDPSLQAHFTLETAPRAALMRPIGGFALKPLGSYRGMEYSRMPRGRNGCRQLGRHPHDMRSCCRRIPGRLSPSSACFRFRRRTQPSKARGRPPPRSTAWISLAPAHLPLP